MATGHRNGGIKIWSVKGQCLIKELPEIHDEAITSVKYMPDGNQILTNSRDNTLKLIDIRTFNVVKTLRSEDYSNGNDCNTVAISSNG